MVDGPLGTPLATCEEDQENTQILWRHFMNFCRNRMPKRTFA
jgi:hypothetical protein